jgi:hypothetical protein
MDEGHIGKDCACGREHEWPGESGECLEPAFSFWIGISKPTFWAAAGILGYIRRTFFAFSKSHRSIPSALDFKTIDQA